jgi:hypothetical protein
VGRVANLRPIVNRPSRNSAILKLSALAIVFFALGCHRSRPDDIVLRYLQLAAALGERDPDALDYYYGPDEWVSDIRKHPPAAGEIRRQALELLSRVRAENSPQGDFLSKQLQAIATRADLLTGARPSFDIEARELFDIEPPPEKNTDDIRREVVRLLPGKGSLAQQYATFDEQFLIAPERVTALMNRAMQECRKRTLQHLSLPTGEQ